MAKIAIMQPYFFPYLGYYRLLASTDIFVIYDCVQFPRRGWVHRNKFMLINGISDWLTLPIKKSPQKTKIKDIYFLDDARDKLTQSLEKFLYLKNRNKSEQLFNLMLNLHENLSTYLISQLKAVSSIFGYTPTILRSSSLYISADLKGEDRIIEINKCLDSKVYINSPGGTSLYSIETFKNHGIEIKFLRPYIGSYSSVFERLLLESIDMLKKEIASNVLFY